MRRSEFSIRFLLFQTQSCSLVLVFFLVSLELFWASPVPYAYIASLFRLTYKGVFIHSSSLETVACASICINGNLNCRFLRALHDSHQAISLSFQDFKQIKDRNLVKKENFLSIKFYVFIWLKCLEHKVSLGFKSRKFFISLKGRLLTYYSYSDSYFYLKLHW